MILSASRRTDIPAYFSDWFYNRVKEGFVFVRNPMNPKQVSKVPIHVDVVDCIVFWTKNPLQMLARLAEIKNYPYYFQFTITPYNQELERNVPNKKNIFDTFKKLSGTIGPQRIIWRYDPILLSTDINIDYHKKYFESICKALSGYTHTCTLSFIDFYKKTERNLSHTTAREPTGEEMQALAAHLGSVAKAYNLKLQTCAEPYDFSTYGIEKGSCIDLQLIENIIGKKLNVAKDKNQRKECQCVESIDIGEYNTCRHNCLYCYANTNLRTVAQKFDLHDRNSPLLIGSVSPYDVVKERPVKSLIKNNMLF